MFVTTLFVVGCGPASSTPGDVGSPDSPGVDHGVLTDTGHDDGDRDASIPDPGSMSDNVGPQDAASDTVGPQDAASDTVGPQDAAVDGDSGAETECLDDQECWGRTEGEVCVLGNCVNACEIEPEHLTNQGCEFYAIDMEQNRDSSDSVYQGENSPFAVVVVNTRGQIAATVTVYRGETLVETVSVPAGEPTVIALDPLNIYGVGITDQTYHILSNLPVVAYQFNPLENVDVYTSDASLLLPVEALGRNYRVVSMPGVGVNADGQFMGSNMAIVAVEDGDTVVSITPGADVPAGYGTLGITAGNTRQYVLARGQVFNVSTASTAGLDLTGSLVSSDKKVAVFSGSVCAMAPTDVCCCDHLEEQVQPIEAWGTEYVVPKTEPRGVAPDMVRVVAHQDNTVVTVAPSAEGAKTLSAGEVYQFEISQSVLVSSDKPVLTALILEGQNAPGAEHAFCIDSSYSGFCDGGSGCYCMEDDGYTITTTPCGDDSDCSDDANIGDPSLIMAVPVEQYRDHYVFLVPTKYADSYISVVAPVGASVTLDGTAIPSLEFSAIATSTYTTVTRHLESGSHTLEADMNVGLYVYGWDRYVSYGYPAGMKLDGVESGD